jgi:hypothetical protein
MVVALVVLAGCGGGSHASQGYAGPDASGHDGAVTDGSGGIDATEDMGVVAQDSGIVDAQEETEPVEAGPCAPLGGACTTSASCYCGLGAGCEDDNVTCSSAGRCVVASPPSLDSGLDPVDECCATCQYTYDTGGTMSAWLACNQACGAGACPVTCLAEVMGSP